MPGSARLPIVISAKYPSTGVSTGSPLSAISVFSAFSSASTASVSISLSKAYIRRSLCVGAFTP